MFYFVWPLTLARSPWRAESVTPTEYTALMLAAIGGRLGVTRLLVAARADLARRNLLVARPAMLTSEVCDTPTQTPS